VTGADEPVVRPGLVAPPVAAEHPGLRLAWTEVAAGPGPTPPDLRERLAATADRMSGPQVLAMRTRAVPQAYRAFFRQVGLDPDAVPTPVEAVALRRLHEGGLPPQNLIDDALTIATIETGVGVWALDAAHIVGALTIREADGGRLVIADETGPLAVLFHPPDPRAAVTKSTSRIALVAVAVPSVPDLYVEEALWTAWDILV
jgi:DNA/RNA-binding domain of Phe-tRNA-synthetase-like protein